MNIKDFVSEIKTYMKAVGWQPAGFNGTWMLLRKNQRNADGTLPEPKPLPDAVIEELGTSCVMRPFIETFLMQNGWVRNTRPFCSTSPSFLRSVNGAIEYAHLPNAFKRQLEVCVLGEKQ